MRKKTLFQVKKFTIAAIMLITSFSLVSCEGEEGPQGPPGEDANVNTEIFNVAGEEWEEDGSMYVVEKTSDLLTQEIIDNGSAHLYLKANADAENDVWIALPYQTMGFAVTVNNLVILTEGSELQIQLQLLSWL